MAKKIINYLHHAGKSYWREILAVFLLLLAIYFFRSQRHELLSLRQHLGNSEPRWIIAGVAYGRHISLHRPAAVIEQLS